MLCPIPKFSVAFSLVVGPQKFFTVNPKMNKLFVYLIFLKDTPVAYLKAKTEKKLKKNIIFPFQILFFAIVI